MQCLTPQSRTGAVLRTLFRVDSLAQITEYSPVGDDMACAWDSLEKDWTVWLLHYAEKEVCLKAAAKFVGLWGLVGPLPRVCTVEDAVIQTLRTSTGEGHSMARRTEHFVRAAAVFMDGLLCQPGGVR